MSEEQAGQQGYERQSIETGLITRGGLIPANLEQMWRLATIMSKSGLMPKGLQTPEAVCVAVQMGLEVGLTPMQAVQNIAVINGRPAVWGDSGIALVEASGLLEDFKETIEEKDGIIKATCWAKRKNRPTPVERTFTTMDAKQAGLHGKEGPWRQYPKRMTQMRARWWVLRDLFADVLKGLKAAEEVQDIIDVTPSGSPGLFVDDLTAAIHDKGPAPAETSPPPEGEGKGTPMNPPPPSFPCPHCKFVAASDGGLKKHITQSHPLQSEGAKKHFGTTSNDIKITGETVTEPPPADPLQNTIEPEDPPEDPGSAEEAPLFPTTENEDDKAFMTEAENYWDAILGHGKAGEVVWGKILGVFDGVKSHTEVKKARRGSFLSTCRVQLEKLDAGK